MKMIMGFIKKLRNNEYVVTAVLSTVGATIAYGVGTVVSYVDSTIAVIVVLCTIRPTLHSSIREGWTQIVGTFIGALVGFAVIYTLGLTPLTFALTLGLSFVISRLMKLGIEGAGMIGLTVVIVIALDFNVETILKRLLGVLVGATVAFVMSYFMKPGQPHDRILYDNSKAISKAAQLLKDISNYLSTHEGKIDPSVAKNWMTRAHSISLSLEIARQEAEETLDHVNWSPFLKEDEVQGVLRQVRLGEELSLTLLNICKNIKLSAKVDNQVLPDTMAIEISSILANTANSIEKQNTMAKESPSALLSKNSLDFVNYSNAKDTATEHLQELPVVQAIIISGSILSDIEKIMDIITE